MSANRQDSKRGTLAMLATVGVLSTLMLTTAGATWAMDMRSMPGMKMAGDMMQATKAGPYRIELHVLAPEAFYTAAQVTEKHLSAGMLIVRGARPLAPDASPAPDHHLIVHVFMGDGGKTVADAAVMISYRKVDGSGHPTGELVHVPVVVMQAIGAGPASTHYGNNVRMQAGSYLVTVAVNDVSTTFRVRL